MNHQPWFSFFFVTLSKSYIIHQDRQKKKKRENIGINLYHNATISRIVFSLQINLAITTGPIVPHLPTHTLVTHQGREIGRHYLPLPLSIKFFLPRS